MRQRLFYFYKGSGLFILLLVLSGCDQVRQSFGLNRSQPDEFMVIDRPALSIPPSIALKPPVPPKADSRKRQQVQNLVLAPPATAYTPPSQAESDLLSKVHANQSPTNIRTMIEEDAKTNTSSEKGLAEDMVFWKKSQPTGDVIDPVAEKERLNSSSHNTSQDTP